MSENSELADKEFPPVWIKSFREFVDEFKNESDRAAVILGAAKLDYLLYQILSKYLLPSVSRSDELLEGDSPLSSFSSKINMCYRLGIVDAEFTRALHLIRKIRNSFAHEVSGCRLDSGPHRDRIRELVAPATRYAGFEIVKKRMIGKKEGIAADFMAILALMVLRLEGLFESITPVNQENTWKLFASKQSTNSPTGEA